MKIKYKFQKEKNVKDYDVISSLDIHTNNIYMYTVNIANGELLVDTNLFGGYKAVLKKLKKCGPKKKVLVLVEAGNQGFSPYRHFQRNGYDCKIIAPNSIPRRGKEQKTDRDDAIDNLHYSHAGLLRYVNVPTEKDEDSREALRYRYQIVMEIRLQKQKILSLIKRTGLVYDLTKSNWTKTHYQWLKTIELPQSARMVLDCRMDQLEATEGRLNKIDDQLDAIVTKDENYQRIVKLYMLIPGIGRIGAMTLLWEGRDLNRFPKAASLMNFTGLIPKKMSSGGKDPALRITKAGNKYLRLAIVGAAKYYRDARYLISKKTLNCMPESLGAFLSRCQTRLNSRYRYLVRRGKPSNKAKVAIAREMCGFLWELFSKQIPNLSTEEIQLAIS